PNMPCTLILQQHEHRRREWLDTYVAITTATLGTFCLVCAYLSEISGTYQDLSDWLPWLAILGTQQVVEMIASTGRMVLIDHYDVGQRPASPNRIILLLFFGYLKMIFGFALIYM